MIEIARRGDLSVYLDGEEIVLSGQGTLVLDEQQTRWLQQLGLPALLARLRDRPPDPIPGQTQLPAA